MFVTKIIGLILVILGAIVFFGGIYLGYEMLITGIVNIIDQCKAPTTEPNIVAGAIFKILFCELPVILGFWVGIYIMLLGGKALVNNETPKHTPLFTEELDNFDENDGRQ